eukprot:4378832-Pleurochrysis_carterae.AAC.1
MTTYWPPGYGVEDRAEARRMLKSARETGEAKKPKLDRAKSTRATVGGAREKYSTGVAARRCWVGESEEKQQTGSRTKRSAQPGKVARLGVVKSQGKKGKEWTTMLSLEKAKASSSWSDT